MAASNAPKRKLRDIWPHLIVSACALLLPPLGMAAGVVYLGASHPQTAVSGHAEQAAPVATAAEPARSADPAPALASTAVVNTAPSPAEPRVLPEPEVAAVPAPQPAAAAPASPKDAGTKDMATKDTTTKDTAAKDAAAKDAAAKDTAAKNAATKETVAKNAAAKDAAAKNAAPKDTAPVSAAKSDDTSEPTARAEAAAPAETADAAAAPAANAQQPPTGQRSRHESRGRVRQARIPSITDIFMHPVRAR
jgi:hypothetical protein